jgi:hypothetical protein
MAIIPESTSPPPQGTSTSSPWWVVYTFLAGSAHTNPTSSSQILQAPSSSVAKANVTKQGLLVTLVTGPYKSKAAATSAEASQPGNTVPGGKPVSGTPDLNPLSGLNGWLQSLGGMIASGLEQGLVSFLGDLWTVIAGPLEVIAGVIIGLFVLLVYFKNDIGSIAGTVAMLA